MLLFNHPHRPLDPSSTGADLWPEWRQIESSLLLLVPVYTPTPPATIFGRNPLLLEFRYSRVKKTPGYISALVYHLMCF